jgi:D-serine deaminase-like pyridoxal phosphate-dependent protein
MTTARDYDYYRSAFAGEAMPFAFLDLEALDKNIREVLARSSDKLIRTASKSVRSIAVLHRILDSDRRFQGLLCFTAPEALYLSDQGFGDLVVAYPTWHPAEIAAVARATREGRPVTLMVDCAAHLDHIEAIGKEHDVRMPVCLDIDMASDFPGIHFGVWRSMVKTYAQTAELAERIASSKYLTLDGLMGYEAQIAGLADKNPGQRIKDSLVRFLKKRSVREVAERRAELVSAIQAKGLKPRFVNGGGTGSINSTCAESAVTEVTVGSAFYAPSLFDRYKDFKYAPAAGFAIEIVRQPRPDLYTCLGGGYIASGIADVSRLPLPWLPEGAALLPQEGAGEVQTPIVYQGSEKLSLGDPIFMRHSKAGELCERFTHLLEVEEGRIVDRVTTYRGDDKCFL